MDKLIKLRKFADNVLDFIYKYRFIIAIILIAIGVLFSLHGSSISLWNAIYSTGIQDSSILFGNWRPIRSDEWAVTTPLIFSQQKSRYMVAFHVSTFILLLISCASFIKSCLDFIISEKSIEFPLEPIPNLTQIYLQLSGVVILNIFFK